MKILIAPSRSRRRPPLGFALIATLSMMILLTLIAVGLLSLSTVTIRSGKAEADLAIARANARLGLMMALSQLQSTLGPDQRVSATADLAGNDQGERLDNGTNPGTTTGAQKYWDSSSNNGLSKVQEGTRYWTGVWGNANPSRPVAGNGNIFERAPRPKLLNWLVSGNESATFKASTAATTFGQITASNGDGGTTAPIFNPGLTVTGLSTSMAAATPVRIDGKDAILLLGPKSAGTANHPTTNEPATDRYVAAPLVEVKSGTQTTGHYAYWVGDEGVKARINLVDPYASNTNAASDPKARYRLMSAPRTGLEAVNDFSNSAYASRTQSANASNNTADRAVSYAQINLIDPPQITPAKTQPRFHDLTTASTGVLADSYNGGLRKDLTALLDTALLSTWTGTDNRTAGTSKGIIPDDYSPAYSGSKIPQWDLIQDFYQYADKTKSGSVTMQSATLTKMGLNPVVSQVRLMFGLYIDGNVNTNTIRTIISPVFVLTNPYSVDLKSTGDLFFRFYLNEKVNGNKNNEPYTFVQYAEPGVNIEGKQTIIGQGEWGMLQTPFKISGPVTIPAGQSKVFSMSGFVQTYNNPSTRSAIVANLVEGDPYSGDVCYGIYEDWNYAGKKNALAKGKLTNFFLRELTKSCWVELMLLDESRNNLQTISGLNFDQPAGYINNTNSPIVSTWPSGIMPFSVMSYALNLPGEDDNAFMAGNPDFAGSHNNTLRPYADFNVRGPLFRYIKRQLTTAPYNWTTGASTDFSGPPYGVAEPLIRDLATPHFGRATTVANSNSIEKAILFDLPRRDSDTEAPIMSIAQLQHANLTADSAPRFPRDTPSQPYSPNAQPSYVNHQPAYAIGNSYQSPFLKRDLAVGKNHEAWFQTGLPAQWQEQQNYYYDISYLLNSSLWDGCFFSSIPRSGASQKPANARYELINEKTNSRDQDAAQNLSVCGAFNVNSTSIDAWTAVLGGMNKLPALSSSDSTDPAKATFARSLRQPGASADGDDLSSKESYTGFRKLSQTELRELATAIVQQVRQRGPFVSLSQFVNRTLVSAENDTAGHGLYGPLQAAIDNSVNNLNFKDASTGVTDEAFIPANLASDRGAPGPYWETTPYQGTYSLFYENKTGDQVDGGLAYAKSDGTKLTDNRSIGIPGWLTQADVLQAIGPILSARSDTFVIRSYGQSVNPTSGDIKARAWCEAVVQRTPEYMNPSEPSTIRPSNLASNENLNWGRRYKIVSFRWLSPEEI